MYKNNEGYADPTAGMAMSLVMKEYRQRQKSAEDRENRKRLMAYGNKRLLPVQAEYRI